MRIIISPAKQMRVDDDNFLPLSKPAFLNEAEQLKEALQQLSAAELRQLWQCNEKIAAENILRLANMDPAHALTPAILAYDGIQYKYMAPMIFERSSLEYIQEHLRILSGFYGILRPQDAVVPYRLEMQAKLAVGGRKNLYEFWHDKLARKLAEETELLIDLASKEYSRAVTAHLPSNVRVVSCVFGELKDDKVIEKGTLCKMARGQMVRWLAERAVTSVEQIKDFRELGYEFAPKYSAENKLVFIKGGTKC